MPIASCLARPARALACLCLIFLLSACPRPAVADDGGSVILVSIDGFRPDYLDRGHTPHLLALAQAGVRAEAMRPAFPSLTFPNHHSLVTGLYPDHHGIVHNVMQDAGLHKRFVYNRADTTADPAWWRGEPIWVRAERAGVRTATMFWPGSEVAIHGARPSRWVPFDSHITPDERVDTVLHWLALERPARPRFLTLYFEHVDRAGHDHGTESDELNAALARIDTAIGRLVDGLDALDPQDRPNLVIVSDHGLSKAGADRVMLLEDIIDLSRIDVVTTGVLSGFTPHPRQQRYADAMLLAPHPHLQCWRKSKLPARMKYGRNARIPPIVCLAEPGWVLATREWAAEHADELSRGEHGYDNIHPDMRALFIAHGPAFLAGVSVPEFNNVDVYPLLAYLLGIRPGRHDGDPRTMLPMLRDPPVGRAAGVTRPATKRGH